MIFDQENLFVDGVATSTYTTTAKASDIIANGAGGSAYDPLFLVAHVGNGALTGGNLTVTLQTAEAENFGGAVELGSYLIKAGTKGAALKVKLPHGALKFLRLNITASATLTGVAKLTAGLVCDVDLK